jgi:8-oxo-dGTP pyrophosphatase MutT (NUDIX family)
LQPALLRTRLATAAEAPVHGDDMHDLTGRQLIPAAVLVPIVLHTEPSVLLTKRTETLRQHSGQVSFPGGRIEPTDVDAEAAALREAAEEIGLDPHAVELVGRLADYVTGTGYRITPVLGLVPPCVALRPQASEVECIFELQVSMLVDPSAPKRRRAFYRGRWREFWVWPHSEHYIWGATAAILLHLAARLRETEERERAKG